MDVLGDLVARERRRTEPLVHSTASQPYTVHKFCTDAWKTASLFRYHGVGPGRNVAIADDARPQALLSLFGAALLGATVRFGLPDDAVASGAAPRLFVGDADVLATLTPPPGTKRIGYRGPPEDSDVIHFERDIWSENPTMPPDVVDPDEPVLATDDETFSHTELLAATDRVVGDVELAAEDAVAVDAPVALPGTVVAGVLAPLTVGAEIVLPGGDEPATVVVTADGDQSDGRHVDPHRITLGE